MLNSQFWKSNICLIDRNILIITYVQHTRVGLVVDSGGWDNVFVAFTLSVLVLGRDYVNLAAEKHGIWICKIRRMMLKSCTFEWGIAGWWLGPHPGHCRLVPRWWRFCRCSTHPFSSRFSKEMIPCKNDYRHQTEINLLGKHTRLAPDRRKIT